MKQILVVDDQPHVLRVLRMALERQGYGVTTVRNGEEALKKIGISAPDAMITDITMPRMNGRELCQRIQSDFPGYRFLIMVMTSNTERAEREWVRAIDGIEFLEKPLSPRSLVARFEEYFHANISNTVRPHG